MKVVNGRHSGNGGDKSGEAEWLFVGVEIGALARRHPSPTSGHSLQQDVHSPTLELGQARADAKRHTDLGVDDKSRCQP